MDLPVQLQSSDTLVRFAQELTALRASFETKVSRVESGAFSIRREFTGLVQQFQSLINLMLQEVEATIIPAERLTEFLNNTVGIDEFAEFDTLVYYNGLVQLRIRILGVNTAIIGLQDQNPSPRSAAQAREAGVEDQLDSDEFSTQGFDSPVFDLQQRYTFYRIKQGDTLKQISSNMYDGDPTRGLEIARANGLFDNDLIDTSQVGRIIRIPLGAQALTNRASRNIVYEEQYSGNTVQEVDRFNYGSGIKLVDGQFSINSKDSISTVQGIDNVVDNLQRRFEITKGTVNPTNIGYGVERIQEEDGVPFFVALERIFLDMEDQALRDGRVISAVVQRNSIDFVGDSIRVNMEIGLVGERSELAEFTLSL